MRLTCRSWLLSLVVVLASFLIPSASAMLGPALHREPPGTVLEWKWEVAGEPWSFVIARRDLRPQGIRVFVGASEAPAKSCGAAKLLSVSNISQVFVFF